MSHWGDEPPTVPKNTPPGVMREVTAIYALALASWWRAKRAPSEEQARAHRQDRDRLCEQAADVVARWVDGAEFERRVNERPGRCWFPEDGYL